jgi:hypothetical protein
MPAAANHFDNRFLIDAYIPLSAATRLDSPMSASDPEKVLIRDGGGVYLTDKPSPQNDLMTRNCMIEWRASSIFG